jgi:hypothetical protein
MKWREPTWEGLGFRGARGARAGTRPVCNLSRWGRGRRGFRYYLGLTWCLVRRGWFRKVGGENEFPLEGSRFCGGPGRSDVTGGWCAEPRCQVRELPSLALLQGGFMHAGSYLYVGPGGFETPLFYR